MLKSMRKYLLILVGSLSLALGIVGIFLPLLPTTPFLLLASLCYLRSSTRRYDWLINHPVLGEYIYNYLKHKAVKQRIRLGALAALWLSLAISIFFMDNPRVRLLLVAVGVGVSIHLFTLKTIDTEAARESTDKLA